MKSAKTWAEEILGDVEPFRLACWADKIREIQRDCIENAPRESPSLDSLLRELHGAVEDLVRHSVVTTAPVWQRLLAARNAVNNYGI
jgi:hypothetical protein